MKSGQKDAEGFRPGKSGLHTSFGSIIAKFVTDEIINVFFRDYPNFVREFETNFLDNTKTPFSVLEMIQLKQFYLGWKRNRYMKHFKHFALYHFISWVVQEDRSLKRTYSYFTSSI
jgi:hypothetical protein